VIVDEAYKEFVDRDDYASCLDLLPRFHNLMVLGTFSKAYGLAGLRIGYGFAQPEVVITLHKIRSPFNTSVPSQVAGIAALGDQEFVSRYVAVNREERDFVCSELQKMGVVTTPSATNFVLMDAPMGGRAFFEKLLLEGVIVRPMAGWGFPSSVRVTFHAREGNERFLAATKKVLNL
jgi:histidinol-phosphate aminotransferase